MWSEKKKLVLYSETDCMQRSRFIYFYQSSKSEQFQRRNTIFGVFVCVRERGELGGKRERTCERVCMELSCRGSSSDLPCSDNGRKDQSKGHLPLVAASPDAWSGEVIDLSSQAPPCIGLPASVYSSAHH